MTGKELRMVEVSRSNIYVLWFTLVSGRKVCGVKNPC